MIDDVLTMIPGPTPVHDRILRQLARPTTSHQFPAFVAAYRACLDDLKRIVFTEQAQPFVVSGSGTLAMEMALVNLVGPQERLLVVSQGYFGDRWTQLAEAFGLPWDVLQAEWGQVVSPSSLKDRLDAGRYAAVTLTHVDTSTGAAAPVAEYASVLRGRDELVILDGVCATAGMEQRFDDWGVDALLTGAQKAFGAPPGLAILLVSQRAMAKRKSRSSVPAYSADLLRWLPIMDNPGLYFSTPPVNEVLAFHEATKVVLEEGLEARFARHATLAAGFRGGIEALGLRLFTDPGCRADTLSLVLYPEGIDDAAFRAEMGRRGVVVAGALGPIAGKGFRVGHMGNIGPAEICTALRAIESSLIELGRDLRPGAALAGAAASFGG